MIYKFNIHQYVEFDKNLNNYHWITFFMQKKLLSSNSKYLIQNTYWFFFYCLKYFSKSIKQALIIIIFFYLSNKSKYLKPNNKCQTHTSLSSATDQILLLVNQFKPSQNMLGNFKYNCFFRDQDRKLGIARVRTNRAIIFTRFLFVLPPILYLSWVYFS